MILTAPALPRPQILVAPDIPKTPPLAVPPGLAPRNHEGWAFVAKPAPLTFGNQLQVPLGHDGDAEFAFEAVWTAVSFANWIAAQDPRDQPILWNWNGDQSFEAWFGPFSQHSLNCVRAIYAGILKRFGAWPPYTVTPSNSNCYNPLDRRGWSGGLTVYVCQQWQFLLDQWERADALIMGLAWGLKYTTSNYTMTVALGPDSDVNNDNNRLAYGLWYGRYATRRFFRDGYDVLPAEWSRKCKSKIQPDLRSNPIPGIVWSKITVNNTTLPDTDDAVDLMARCVWTGTSALEMMLFDLDANRRLQLWNYQDEGWKDPNSGVQFRWLTGAGAWFGDYDYDKFWNLRSAVWEMFDALRSTKPIRLLPHPFQCVEGEHVAKQGDDILVCPSFFALDTAAQALLLLEAVAPAELSSEGRANLAGWLHERYRGNQYCLGPAEYTAPDLRPSYHEQMQLSFDPDDFYKVHEAHCPKGVGSKFRRASQEAFRWVDAAWRFLHRLEKLSLEDRKRMWRYSNTSHSAPDVVNMFSPSLQDWFGVYTDDAWKKVTWTIGRLVRRYQWGWSFWRNSKHPTERFQFYCYWAKGDVTRHFPAGTIYFSQEWRDDSTDTTRASTLLHESLHFLEEDEKNHPHDVKNDACTAGHDKCYNTDAWRLARADPAEARDNNDNYRYWIRRHYETYKGGWPELGAGDKDTWVNDPIQDPDGADPDKPKWVFKGRLDFEDQDDDEFP